VSRAERERGALAHRWNRWRRWFWLVFAAFVLFVLWRAAAHLDWREVGAAIAARDVGMLLLIAAGALASHALFATLDVLSRRFAGLRLRSGRVWLTATVCYAAALNLGALIGSLGLRVRLYRRQGVRGGAISRMVAAGVLGNWSGHFALLALVPWFASEATRARWSADVGGWPVSLVAATMLLAYFALVARGVPLRWRQRRLRLPPLRVALAQLAVATANWALMGALLYLGIGSDRIAYADVLIALLFAAVAGVITHVPGGWGVLEFAVALLLSHRVPTEQLVAGVLLYRAAYYLLPLALAGGSYVWLERVSSGGGKRVEVHADTAPRRRAHVAAASDA
jgi:uncharacterized membrane protein YbhN (UPF0104 family)